MPKPIVVMKFGGTSVAEAEGRAAAIRRIRRVQDEGCAAVVVVSAMGRRGQPYATDTLLSLAPEGDAAGRDLLMSCGETISACVMASDLLEHGVRAVPMSGADARIRTDGAFGRAEITGMDVSAVAALLEEDAVPVVTGFQGLGPDGRVTTLGRGGSDTSAVEIAGYLGAREALIFTDVPGVAVCDPRVVPEAPYLQRLDSRDIGLLAEYGAKVIHPRAVAAGQKHRVPIRVLSTFDERPGTEICELPDPPRGLVGIAMLRSCAVGRNRTMNALACGDRWAVPGSGETTLISALRRPLAEERAGAVAGLGETTRTGRLLQLLVPDRAADQAARCVYDILK